MTIGVDRTLRLVFVVVAAAASSSSAPPSSPRRLAAPGWTAFALGYRRGEVATPPTTRTTTAVANSIFPASSLADMPSRWWNSECCYPERNGRDFDAGMDPRHGRLPINRREVLASAGTASLVAFFTAFQIIPIDSALAENGASTSESEPYVRRGKDFAYMFVPPPGFVPGNKPLKTHLDEVNFEMRQKEGGSEGSGIFRGYQYGVTVDPVRIVSLRQFGTPEEVAARVVTAEVNRDGVFEVTLAKDPIEDVDSGSYLLEYISDGKRGKKRFVTRIYVQDRKLYVLTAQSKEADYTADREREMSECVGSFRPL